MTIGIRENTFHCPVGCCEGCAICGCIREIDAGRGRKVRNGYYGRVTLVDDAQCQKV